MPINNQNNKDELKKIFEQMTNEEREEKKEEKKFYFYFNLPYWFIFGWLFWLISFLGSFIPSYLHKISEGHCDILPDIYCIPAIASSLMFPVITFFEYPINIILKLFDSNFQYYSEKMLFQFDFPKIFLISTLYLLIGIVFGSIFKKISKRDITDTNKRAVYLSSVILIILLSLLVQFHNYRKHSNFNSIEIKKFAQQQNVVTKKEVLPYKINGYKDFEQSPFCKKYNCKMIGVGDNKNTKEKFRKYKLDNDDYLEIFYSDSGIESIMILDWSAKYRMKGDDFNVFFDLLRSIDSSLEINDPNDSAVDFIINHSHDTQIFGQTDVTSWGPTYYISSGRTEDGRHQGMYIGRRE